MNPLDIPSVDQFSQFKQVDGFLFSEELRDFLVDNDVLAELHRAVQVDGVDKGYITFEYDKFWGDDDTKQRLREYFESKGYYFRTEETPTHDRWRDSYVIGWGEPIY